ncbi:MAG: glutathione synthase [Pseudomonadota bacterium]
MARSIGVVMDPIEGINSKKDSTFAMLLEAQRRGWRIHYFTAGDLWVENGVAHGRSRNLELRDNPADWFSWIGEAETVALGSLDVILMRRDPPFDLEYINDTYALERAEIAGALVVNRPQALRDANEKYFTAWFAELGPPTLFSRDQTRLRAFVLEQGRAVIKPVDGMGGASIFQLHRDDPNINVALETVSEEGRRVVVAQKYVPEITAGDKRILIVDGEAVPCALARIPSSEDFRGNLARGGTGEGLELTERDREICEQVGPELAARGILFAGLDVIGDYLTEINVTSPTCIRELDSIFDLNIAGILFDAIERQLAARG